MSAHTSGPWVISDLYLDDKGYPEIAILATTDGDDLYPAAVCLQFPTGHEMQMANARLIAAAPELLAALQELADDIADRFDMDSPSTNPGIKHTVTAARAAIAKATGAAA